jgi:hypothetical protein
MLSKKGKKMTLKQHTMRNLAVGAITSGMLLTVSIAAKAASSLSDDSSATPATLSQEIADLKAKLNKVQKTADDALKATNTSYGPALVTKSPYVISGYGQFRYEQVGTSSNSFRYPNGLAHTPAGANGDYQNFGAPDGFEIRRMGVGIAGSTSPNTKYSLNTTFSGAVSNSTNSQIALLDAWGAYTFGDGSSKYPTLTAGQFPQVFGYTLGTSSSVRITPERSLAFGIDSTLTSIAATTSLASGLWASQDYDKGVSVAYGPGKFRGTFAIIDGTGRSSDEKQTGVNNVSRVTYTINRVQKAGVSYYNGNLPTSTTTTGSLNSNPKRELFGIDYEYLPATGPFAIAEGLAGLYETRSFFDQASSIAGTPSSTYDYYNQSYAPGNTVQGYYVQSGYTWNGTSKHPFTIAGGYDFLNRSASGYNNDKVSVTSGGGSSTTNYGGASGKSNWIDSSWEVGTLYNQCRPCRWNGCADQYPSLHCRASN